jgi:MSHA pilin protein MshD
MSINRNRGMTLIELVMAIVIIGVGVAGVMLVFSTVVGRSADPIARKQMLAIAEEMMEEITLQTFDVPGVVPANGLRVCTTGTGVAPRTAFNDVADFNGYQTTGICNLDGDAITSLSTYSLVVTVTPANAIGDKALGAGDVWQITVTVTHGTDSLTLVGWRARY